MLAPDLLAALRPGDVLLVGRRGGISDVIRAVTHSQWSHAALVAQSASAWIVIEATMDVNGVAARKIEVITDDPTVEYLGLYRALAAAGWEDAIVKAMWLETGQPYSNRVNIEIGLGIPVAAADGVNCVAAVNDAYHAGCGTWLIDPSRPVPELLAQSPKVLCVWAQHRPLAQTGANEVQSP